MEQTTVTQESKGFYKLNWLQRIGFGSGDKTSSTRPSVCICCSSTQTSMVSILA